MPRSRADIEADLNESWCRTERLVHELAGTQPDTITLHSFSGLSSLCLSSDRTTLRVDPRGQAWHGAYSRLTLNNLRDWLNYHFPKETI